MNGRWTIHYVAEHLMRDLGDQVDNASVEGPGFDFPSVPVVPCDDAAVERVATALGDDFLHDSMDELRDRAEAVLRAAGETP